MPDDKTDPREADEVQATGSASEVADDLPWHVAIFRHLERVIQIAETP